MLDNFMIFVHAVMLRDTIYIIIRDLSQKLRQFENRKFFQKHSVNLNFDQ